MVYGILASDQWATQTGLLPHDPQIMALSRQSLTGTLTAPCPETEPDSSSPISPVDLDRLQENLLSLAQQVVQPQTSHPDMVESCQVGAGLPCFFVVKLRNDSQASTGRDALATFDHSDIRGLGTARPGFVTELPLSNDGSFGVNLFP